MRPEDIFRPYTDTPMAHVMEVMEYLVLMILILWIQTGVTSGTSEFDIVDFTFKLGMIGFVLKLADLVIWQTWRSAPKKVMMSPIQTLGLGSGWRSFWGIICGLFLIGLISGTSNLSFFYSFMSFNSTYMFWFLVFIGPRIEETFSNVIHPLVTSILRNNFNLSYLAAGTISLLFVVAPLFGAFHYFTYYSKSGQNMATLAIMIAAAYIYRCIFTIGNYFFKTDEFGKWAHSLHNYIGFSASIGPASKILPAEQFFLIIMVFLALGVYFISLALFRIGKYKFIKGIMPDTIFSGPD